MMNIKALSHTIILTLITLLVTMTTSSAEELASHLHKTTLDNGLTVIVKETPGTKVATAQIWIKAGSVYEDEEEGGITHVIEHMIFKGTPNRGAGEIAGAIEEAGGRINAYTSYEYTVYHATLSSRHWGLAMDVLTDAVLHSTFDADELEKEKKVVLEEIAMREDRPNVKLFQELMRHSYEKHPYRRPIIGTRESVSSFTREDLLHYVNKHYTPENMTVVMVGDVKANQVMDKVNELYAGLSASDYRQPELPEEPEKQAAGFFNLFEDIKQTHLALSVPTTPFDHPDSPVLDVIAGILGQGDTSRLYHQLRNKKGLVYRIHGSSFTPRDQGLFEVVATLDADNLVPALEGILEEMFKLKYVPVSDEELARVKRNLESDFVFNLERVEGQARILGSFEFLAGDPREEDYLTKIRSVTKEDIKRVAGTYFTDEVITAGMIGPEKIAPGLSTEDLRKIIDRSENLARHGVPATLVEDSFLPNVYRYKLPNGITLLVREDPKISTVAIRAVFPGGLRSETLSTNGAFAFISQLLPKGTKDLNHRQLSLKIADMAGDISGFNGKNTFGLKGDFLSRFFPEGLELFRDIIREPAFSPEEAEKIRPELLSQLRQQEDSLPALGFREFNRLLFQGHPYALNTAGSEAAIRRLSAEELKKIYNNHAVPENMVLAIAGDVKAKKVRDMVEKMFGEWSQKNDTDIDFAEESVLSPSRPPDPVLKNIPKEREQVHIIIGFLGTSLTSEDRYPLEILDTVLSGQSGRLFTELRDKQSLAYSLSSFSLLGLDTGSFGIYIGTSPDKKNEAIQGVWKELYQVRNEPISEEELQKARNILISNYELGLQTHGSQAMDMALSDTYGLGQDFGNRYIEELEKVDAEAVMAIARKYILPDHYVMISVGADAGEVEMPGPESDVAEPTPTPEKTGPSPGKPEKKNEATVTEDAPGDS